MSIRRYILLIMKAKKHDLQICPTCKDHLIATELSCESCEIKISGRFSLGPVGMEQLFPEQRYFVLTFLKCRGNIKEVEKELGISYPTVRNRLDEILRLLGFPTGEETRVTREEEKAAGEATKDVINALAAGKINVDEAVKRLKK